MDEGSKQCANAVAVPPLRDPGISRNPAQHELPRFSLCMVILRLASDWASLAMTLAS